MYYIAWIFATLTLVLLAMGFWKRFNVSSTRTEINNVNKKMLFISDFTVFITSNTYFDSGTCQAMLNRLIDYIITNKKLLTYDDNIRLICLISYLNYQLSIIDSNEAVSKLGEDELSHIYNPINEKVTTVLAMCEFNEKWRFLLSNYTIGRIRQLHQLIDDVLFKDECEKFIKLHNELNSSQN